MFIKKYLYLFVIDLKPTITLSMSLYHQTFSSNINLGEIISILLQMACKKI